MTDRVRITDLAAPDLTEAESARHAFAAEQVFDLSVDGILTAAREATGLSDFGEADNFEARLEMMIAETRDDPASSAVGKFEWFEEYVLAAMNRLRVTEIYKRHPEIADEVIEAPIIVAGIPRSGTTHLVNLMGADKRFRTLSMWESREPVSHDFAQALPEKEEDPRYVRMLAFLRAQEGVLPLRGLMHTIDPDHIEEDGWIGSLSFQGFGPEVDRRAPKWRAFYEASDMRPYYRYIAKVLKILQWYRPGERWLLKNVQNMEHMPAILEVFPDATIVATQRDPLASVQSLTTMMMYRSRMYYTQHDKQWYLEYFTELVRRLLAGHVRDRSRIDPQHLIDVYFDVFMRDEIGTVRRVYERAGLEMTPAALAELQAYREANRAERGVSVAYDFREDFAVEPDDIRRVFDFYFEALPTRIEVR